LYASDGWVDLYADGTIQSQNKFQKIVNGEELAEISVDGISKSDQKRIRLGGEIFKEGTDDALNEIDRIKKIRQNNEAERINELGRDMDKGGPNDINIIEGQVGFDLEERYGYFARYKSSPEKKGDWISLSGPYKGKTFDEFGGGIDEKALEVFSKVPVQKKLYFKSIDLHFDKADYVILNLTKMKIVNPELYQETLQYIVNKYGNSKLINITK